MNKKTLLVILMIILSLTFVSADENETELELTGTVTVYNRIHPVLNVEGTEYLLLVPKYFNINDGDTITVKGKVVTEEFKNDCPRFDDDATYLFVTIITINGKTYDIEKEFGDHRRGRGRRGDKGRGRADGKGYGKNNGNCW